MVLLEGGIGMGKKTVEILPAIREMEKPDKRKRAAAYCRVSTNMAEQEGSFEMQKQYYETYIGGKPNWELAGIYADKGVRYPYPLPET